MDRERRIPPFTEDALKMLNEAVGNADDGDDGDGLPKDDARELIAEDNRFTVAMLSTRSTCFRAAGTSTTSTNKCGSH